MKRIILMILMVILCGSIWAENVFVADNWVFSRNDGESIQKDVVIEIKGKMYNSFIVELRGKYKFQVMLDGGSVSSYSKPEAYKYGLPEFWGSKYVIVKYYIEQTTSLVEYTESVQSRLKRLI